MIRQKLILNHCNKLALFGGVTETVFPLTELKLMESGYHKSLLRVSKKKKKILTKYESLMDFLFCEIFNEPWKKKCFNYYEGNGCQLKDDPLVDNNLLHVYDVILCDLVLELCKIAYDASIDMTWNLLTFGVNKIIEKGNVMVECTCRKIYETNNKVGVKCFHPARVGYLEEPKRITCGLVCQVCDLDKTVEPWDSEPVVNDNEPEDGTNPDD